MPDGQQTTQNADRRPGLRPRAVTAIVCAGLVAVGLAFALVLSLGALPLSATNVRAQVEDRLAALSGRQVFVDGTITYDFLPQPRMILGDVRMGGADSGPVLLVDQVRAEFDLFDALFGRMDLDRLVLVRPELDLAHAATDTSSPAGDPANADAAAQSAVLVHARSLMQRLEGVRILELRDGLFRPRADRPEFSSVDAVLSWPSPAESARASGAFVWNGQRTEFALRAERPDRFADGDASGVEASFRAPPLDLTFAGRMSAGDGVSFDGSLRLSAPSLPRVARWLGNGGAPLPDIGATTLEASLDLRDERAAFRSVRATIGDQPGQGVLEAVLTDGRPSISGTLAFARFDLDRVARGIAPMPRHALDYQRPMTISFARAFDLDLRLSATEAGLGDVPMRQLAASLKVSRQSAKLDVSDAEVLGGRAQGSLTIDLSRERPLALGRIDLRGVEAASLGAITGLGPVAPTGRADLSARFEAPATNWAEVLRDNSSTIDIVLSQGGFTGVSPDLFATVGQVPLELPAHGAAMAFDSLTATLGTRGPYATLDALRIAGERGTLEAGGFLSLLDERFFVEGNFVPAEGPGREVFTSSQPVPFRMEGQWPNPTLVVGSGPGIQPI